MKYDPDIHHRCSIWLKNYDYSRRGLYFITICTQNRLCSLGGIKKGETILNDAGKMIKIVWDEIPVYYQRLNVHEFVVMPNHIHGIIQILSNVGAGPCVCHNSCNSNNIGQPQGGCPYNVIFRCCSMLVYDNPIKAGDMEAKVTYHFQILKISIHARSSQIMFWNGF